MMLSCTRRIGGPPTSARDRDGGLGLIGFGIAIAVLHVAALPFGSAGRAELAPGQPGQLNLGFWCDWSNDRVLPVYFLPSRKRRQPRASRCPISGYNP